MTSNARWMPLVRAFLAWAATPVAERVRLLRALARSLQARARRSATPSPLRWGRPTGSPTRSSRPAATVVAGYADLLENYEFDETVGNTLVTREPAGVVGAITPWNYPLHQITCKLAPALAAGCTFVLKPSEVTPLVAYELFDASTRRGFPAGVVNLVPGYGHSVGEALAGHPGIDVMSFTGSVRRAGASPNSPPERDAGDPRTRWQVGEHHPRRRRAGTSVKVGVANAFLNSGQTCTAWTRMLVPADTVRGGGRTRRRVRRQVRRR